MIRSIWTGAALAGLALVMASAAPAQDNAPDQSSGKQCFYSRDISSWAPVDRSTVNLRVHVGEVYQLSLLGDCPNIDWVEGIGLEHRGSSWICTGLDAELLVPQPGGGHSFPIRCPVKSIRKLSKDEVKALPPKQHP